MSDQMTRPAPEAATTRTAVTLVLATSLTVAAWLIHLSALASLAGEARHSTPALVAMNLITVVTGLVCAAVIGLGAWHVHLLGSTGEGEGSPAGRTVFLAWLAVILGATNLLLILFEGSYVFLIDRHA
jgi:hypothetical protein